MRIESFGRKVFVVCNILILTLLCFLCLYPMVYVLFASLSDANMLMQHRGFLWAPLKFNFEAYKTIRSNSMILSGYLNTIFVVLVGVALNMVMTSIGAYFLSRKNVMLKNFIMGYITLTMFFGGGLIPLYLTVKNLGMYNSLWALIFPAAVNTFNLIIMRTAFMSIPDSLEEAAVIDGAGHFTILFKVVLPLSVAIIAVMVLFYGVAHWNSWFSAMIFLNDRQKFPLQLVLMEILIQNDTQSMTMGAGVVDTINIAKTVKYAVIMVATIPILCVYPFLQKNFTQGVLIGAVKG